jgi:hypothetical protein
MNTLENIREIRNVDKENSFGHQEIITKVNTWMMKETAMVK